MRQSTRKGLMTVVAATGALAAAGGSAHADSGATGAAAHSPGVLSGNTVQAPVHVPVNVCGNTVNVVGLLDPAAGNACADQGRGGATGGSDRPGGAHTGGHTAGSPGVGSGNTVQVPIDVPVNVCGNSVDVIGVGNAVTGNNCAGVGPTGGHPAGPPGGSTTPPGGGRVTPPGGHHGTPPGGERITIPPGNPGRPDRPQNPGTPGHPSTPGTPPPAAGNTPVGISHLRPQSGGSELASTGSGLPLGITLPVGAGAVLAGTVLYRRARASA
jgi:hypothetical protein